MTARPWMPLYVADYLADTQHLSATESGAYLHLLMYQWQHGPIPADNGSLMRITRVHPPHWPRIRRILEPFFDITKTPGSWVQQRLDQEITKMVDISQKRANAAVQMHSKSRAPAVQVQPHFTLTKKERGFSESGSKKAANGSNGSAYLWIVREHPQWPLYAAAWRSENPGKRGPPTKPGLGGMGWHFAPLRETPPVIPR